MSTPRFSDAVRLRILQNIFFALAASFLLHLLLGSVLQMMGLLSSPSPIAHIVFSSLLQILCYGGVGLFFYRHTFSTDMSLDMPAVRPLVLLGLAVVIFVAIQPLNSLLHLTPSGDMARRSAEEYMTNVRRVVQAPLPLVLLATAVIPPVCEEIFFRGFINRALMTVLPGLGGRIGAILIGAAIFSAIHMEFTGLLQRFVLGAVLGFLVLVSGSVIPAILAHLVNNAAFILFLTLGKDTVWEKVAVDNISLPLWAYVLSALITTGGVILYHRLAPRSNHSSLADQP
jgi:membrane protease YdiL (CAAX protease family)